MDGRVNQTIMTKVPIGIIRSHSNIGGKFDMGWHYFGNLMRKWVEYSMSKNRNCVVMSTYHFSKGDHHRGCAGFGYDTEAAKLHTRNLMTDLIEVFGNDIFYAIQVGVETDEDALIIHGDDGSVLNLAEENIMSKEELFFKLRTLFPRMKENVVWDLVPIFAGNQQHIEEVRLSQRPIISLDHTEQVLCVGRDFDWLEAPNKALIVGPYSFNIGGPIEVAAKVLLSNILNSRITKDEGIQVITSAVCDPDMDFRYKQATFQAKALATYTMEVIETRVPELLEFLCDKPLVGVLNYNTYKFDLI